MEGRKNKPNGPGGPNLWLEEWEERAAILEYEAGFDRAEAERRAGPIDGLFQLDSGYACGGVFVSDGQIVDAAPIFRKLVGSSFDAIRKRYRAVFAGPRAGRNLYNLPARKD